MGEHLCETMRMEFWRKFKAALPLGVATALLSVPPTEVDAQANVPTTFDGYVQYLAAKARGEGVRESTITAMTSGLAFTPRAIELDRSTGEVFVTRPDGTPYEIGPSQPFRPTGRTSPSHGSPLNGLADAA